MIIKFDQSPEEYFRLAQHAFGKREFDRALFYAEKAVSGKASAEHRLLVAEILFAMKRYADATDIAIEVLCYSRGMRAEAYDLLARTAGEWGYFYESLHYIAQKAHYEGDDDTLDAMDEVMHEMSSEKEEAEDSHLFLVGKEQKQNPAVAVMQANYALSRGEYEEAIRLASEVEEGTEDYFRARLVCMRAFERLKLHDRAIAEAESLVQKEPHNGYVLYTLIDKYKKSEYLPLLKQAEGEKEGLYYAIVAAEHAGEYDTALALAGKILQAHPYDPEALFMSAAIALNGGEKEKSTELLKQLFSLYSKYPAQVILQGWKRLKSCDADFAGQLPNKVMRLLASYVKKQADTAEHFERAMLTDESFRASLRWVFQSEERVLAEGIAAFLGEVENREIDAFFAKLLIRFDVDLLYKRAILERLLARKHKGSIPLSQAMIFQRVPCAKPTHYEEYCPALKEAYLKVISFVYAMTDADCEARLKEMAERAHDFRAFAEVGQEMIVAAFLLVLLSEDRIPMGGASSAEDACLFILAFVFGIEDLPIVRAEIFATALKKGRITTEKEENK